jgi:hypothetical protein
VEEIFCQLLKVHDVSNIRKLEVHAAEPLVTGPTHCEVETDIAKLKAYKLPGKVKQVKLSP